MPIPTIGYAIQEPNTQLQPFKYEHRDLGPSDVHISIIACGVCQTDIHVAQNEWKNSIYPVVPGHEITGYVESVGSNVTKFKKGDKVGVGYLAETCESCKYCTSNREQYCDKRVPSLNGTLTKSGVRTYGGYARDIVIDENLVCRFPDGLDLYEGAPLLCAGITVYSALKNFKMDSPGKKLAVIGLGGLGHMAVKFGVAFGLEVTVISRSESKRNEAIEELGAHKFLNSNDAGALAEVKGTLDILIDTTSAPKNMGLYLSLLDIDGVFVVVGVPEKPLEIQGGQLIRNRIKIVGSLVGSIAETEEMLEFCAVHKVVPLIEKVSIEYVNTAWERLLNSDVHYRFVLDIGKTCPQI